MFKSKFRNFVTSICIDMNRNFIIILLLFCLIPVAGSAHSKKKQLAPAYAWKLMSPLGLRETSTIDTTLMNYYRLSIPSEVSDAYATTGNLGAEGLNMIFFERPQMSEFFFLDALNAWLPSESKMRFYNTRIPMTLLSYNFGGTDENSQDHLSMVFSGNANKKVQIGGLLDYIYSRGSYEYQATNDLTWGFSGSYTSDRYEFQGYFNHFNFLNKENGGITDDRFITDPSQVQGGSGTFSPKTIPTNLTAAHSKVVGQEFYMNHRYKVGFYREEKVPDNDTLVIEKYIPVVSFIWTMKYNSAKHIFLNSSASDDDAFWKNTYLQKGETNDRNNYSNLSNTFGVSLLEGFNKYAKAGLSAFVTHELRTFHQTAAEVLLEETTPDGLDPSPVTVIPPKKTQNLLYVGAQLTRQTGRILNYDATAKFGLVGPSVGEVYVDGRVYTHIPLFKDTVTVCGYGHFENRSAPYLMNNYVSNHFIWNNDFGQTRNARFGGFIDIPRTHTRIEAGVENIQNHIYFNSDCLPEQYSGSVQVFSASLRQNFKFGILQWQNNVTYQTSSRQEVIPLPKLAVYTNLFLWFKVAKVLQVQTGVDCNYYTKYMAVGYQPATMSFYNQREVECGGFPFMTVYANMKLSKTRFYVMYSHFNQGMTKDNYFSMPHYPLNPARFQLGLSIDFAN